MGVRKKVISKAEKSKVMVTAHLCAPRASQGWWKRKSRSRLLGSLWDRDSGRCHFYTKILIHPTIHMGKCTWI